MAWTTPRTWAAGEVITAAIMNTHVRDNFNALGSPWTSFTPTWTANTANPSIGNGTMVGNYIQAGKLVMFRIIITAGSTTNWGTGTYSWAYPVAPVTSTNGTGLALTGVYWNNGGNQPWGLTCVSNGSSTFRMATTSGNSFITNAYPVAGATGNIISVSGTYEAA